jgi:succinate dehydrogenase hydrophobic anchor subunit
MVVAFMREIFGTIFGGCNFQITNDRTGLTRSAVFLLIFIAIHAIGNLHVFLGPDDFNGYGYFYVRLYWTGFGLPANIVEIYVALCAVLHVIVALKRTWDISANYTLKSGKLNMAISGVVLLSFMTLHLFQFRFGATQLYEVRPPPYLINFAGILSLNLFWTKDTSVAPVEVRDIYKLEFDLFQDIHWVLFYLGAVFFAGWHMCLGAEKLIPASSMNIQPGRQKRAVMIVKAVIYVLCLIYASFPIYCHVFPMKQGNLGHS